jgi:cbb3-type cytochrome oxidase maturation protein
VEILILTLFVSLVLALGGVGFFVWSVRQGAHEHSDRLALLPLRDDAPPRTDPRADAAEPPSDTVPPHD